MCSLEESCRSQGEVCPLDRVAAAGAFRASEAAAEGDDAGDDAEGQEQEAGHPRPLRSALFHLSFLQGEEKKRYESQSFIFHSNFFFHLD